MAAYFITATLDRVQIMDFTTALYLTEYVLLVPYPDQDKGLGHLTAPLKPFSTAVIISDELF